MPLFRWNGIDKTGTSQRGVLQALDAMHAEKALMQRGIAPFTVKQGSPLLEQLQARFLPPPSTYHLHLLFMHLASFLQAGIPLKQALTSAAKTQRNRKLREDIKSLELQLEQGIPFYEGLAQLPYLPAYTQQLVHAAEEIGSLPQTLGRLGTMLLAEHKRTEHMRTAATGPTITIGFAVVISLVAFSVLLPQLGNLYRQCNLPLPLLVSFSSKLVSLLTLRSVLGMGLGLSVLAAGIKHYAPPLGITHWRHASTAAVQQDIMRWVSIMRAYLESGTPLLEGCRQASTLAKTTIARRLLDECIVALTQGRSLSSVLEEEETNNSSAALALLTPLVRAGEESGNLAAMLAQAEDELSLALSHQADRFAHIVGPLLTVLVGLCVGGLLLMLYLPIMQLGSIIR